MALPTEFYYEQIKKHKKKLSKRSRILSFLSLLRFLVFFGTAYLTYCYFFNYQVSLLIAISGTIIFIALVSLYSNLKYQESKLGALIEINENELKTLNREFSFRDPGNEYIDNQHDFSSDIDLFGNGSFFQYLNRTVTNAGKELLASVLLSNNIDTITDKQEAVKELCDKPEWRQEFSATAYLVKPETATNTILNWLLNYEPYLTHRMAFLPLIFSSLSLIIILFTVLGYLGFLVLGIWFILGLCITGYYLKKTNRLSFITSKMQSTFEQYFKLIQYIERESFLSKPLKEGKANVFVGNNKASKNIKSFSSAIDALDQRNNVFIALFGNAFFLWDLIQGYRIEKWIKIHQKEVKHWFDAIAFFDAYNSLGNFAFNHPEYVYPEIVDSNFVMKAENLGHPLIKKENLVRNDIQIEKEKFFIITGANMAGKSTFLRTVSLHLLMANTGIPVCATKSLYCPIKLITSMRTSDSLTNEESYFFSELKRLKYIVENMENSNYFVILDEILKGTNSKDKAEGSKKFIERLSALTSTGIVATHDLSLCEIAEKNQKVENYRFDAYIKNDELSFDYKLKKGICKNMNASFLMKKMGIIN